MVSKLRLAFDTFSQDGVSAQSAPPKLCTLESVKQDALGIEAAKWPAGAALAAAVDTEPNGKRAKLERLGVVTTLWQHVMVLCGWFYVLV